MGPVKHTLATSGPALLGASVLVMSLPVLAGFLLDC